MAEEVRKVLEGSARWCALVGDVRETLRTLPDGCVQCCVTSPPYYGLRDYGTGEWEGGDPECSHGVRRWDGPKQTQGAQSGHASIADSLRKIQCDCGATKKDKQIGLEQTPQEYVDALVAVFREVRRALADDGVAWLNLGDSYAANRTYQVTPTKWKSLPQGQASRVPDGLKPKDLLGIPWMVAFALRADGWWLRSDVVWCISGGAVVYARTQKGDAPTTIKDLVRLDPPTVQLWNGSKWTRVLGWGASNDTSQRVEIVLRSGERVGCTGGHEWPTQRGNVAARDLVVGDVLATCELPEPDGATAPGYLTTDAAWLVGLYLAEGSRADDTLQLSLHADEAPWLPRIESVARHLGGTMAHTLDGNNLSVRLYGRVVAAMVESYVGGNTAHDKHLTNAAWRLPNTHLRAVAQGYLDGDGHCDPANNRVRLGFARNYFLERDLRTLAARLGATLSLRPTVATCQTGKFPAFRGEWRWSRSGHHNERDRGEVVEIRASKARKFWDIAVEDDPHLFALASGVLTHNCKPNPMPESVTDRPTRAHEYVFLLTRSARYFYDAEAIMEPRVCGDHLRHGTPNGAWIPPGQPTQSGINRRRLQGGAPSDASTRNARSVWTIAPEPYAGAHFATMPPDLARRCILAGSRKGDVVLDPFGGAGTTALVAVAHGRRAILCELNADYVALQRERLASVDTTTTEPVRALAADFGPLFGGSR